MLDFFLQTINRIVWSNIIKSGYEEPTELNESGFTLEDAQSLVLPVMEKLQHINAVILENEQPQKVLSQLLDTEYKKDALDFEYETKKYKNVSTKKKCGKSKK